MFTAWIDESLSNSRLDPGVYLLGAAIVADDLVEHARESMRALRRPGQRKVHWRDDQRCVEIIKVVAGLGIKLLVAVRCEPGTDALQERQRRLCLARLLQELESLGVAHATFESRGRKNDQRDREALVNIRRSKLLSGDLRIDHISGQADPLLWVPDACCGAVSQHRCGNSTYLDAIASSVTILSVDR